MSVKARMQSYNRHIKNIIHAKNNNRLAVFIGAGFSKASENETNKIPSWSELISGLQKDLSDGNKETDYLKLAQLYYIEFGEYNYIERIKSFFPSGLRPTHLHTELFEIDPQVIITTNWDTLLEDAAKDGAFVYETISSDEDLVKSSTQKKIIKMHGDFAHHNIVFKEDDYIGYSDNFPLIENYLKSILSTHTIIFIGYSYSDTDLKHIVKWLQKRSNSTPPRYLLTFDQNATQAKYLEGHNICVLNLGGAGIDSETQEAKTKLVSSFLSQVKDESSFIDIESEEDVIGYMESHAKIFAGLKGILHEQLTSRVTNSSIEFPGENFSLLKLYDKESTYDFNQLTRQIHSRYIAIANRYHTNSQRNKGIDSFFETLYSAGIDGLFVSEDGHNISYVPSIRNHRAESVENFLEKIISFDWLNPWELTDASEQAFMLHIAGFPVDALSKTDEIISDSMQKNDYAKLFISMFNRNLVLRELAHDFDIPNREKYQQIRQYDLREKFSSLPREHRKMLEPIYNFINFDHLYKYAYDLSGDLNKKIGQAKTVRNGGFVFSNDPGRAKKKHANILKFVIGNGLFLEQYTEFKRVIKLFIEIKIARNLQSTSLILDRLELYSCLQYFDFSELAEILDAYCDSEPASKRIELSEDGLAWLINTVIPNIIKLMQSKHSFSSPFDKVMTNAFHFVSISRLSADQLRFVMGMYTSIVAGNASTYDVYKSFNRFIALQHKMYSANIEHDDILKFIDSMLDKIAYRRIRGNEHLAFRTNAASNVFAYASNVGLKYSNISQVEKVILEISKLPATDQVQMYREILVSIFDIGSTDVKHIIQNYMTGIEADKIVSQEDKINHYLLLVLYGFSRQRAALARLISIYINGLASRKAYSTFERHILSHINAINKRYKIKTFDRIKKTLEERQEEYRMIKNTSIL